MRPGPGPGRHQPGKHRHIRALRLREASDAFPTAPARGRDGVRPGQRDDPNGKCRANFGWAGGMTVAGDGSSQGILLKYVR
jgi:hypothetical protein